MSAISHWRRPSWRPIRVSPEVNRLGTSPLYALRPLGLGTPYVESLTSYITRLAEEHCTRASLLLNHFVLARSEVNHGGGLSRSKNLGPGINGDTRVTEVVLACLEALTWVPQVRSTALFGRIPGIFIQRSYRTSRAWCVECFREDAPYDRLLWSLKAYDICVRHERPLVDVCPECQQSHRPLHSAVRSARCPCGADLAKGALPRARSAGKGARILEDVIARIESGRTVTREQVVAGTTALVRSAGGWKLAAEWVGIPEPSVRASTFLRKSVELEALLKFVVASGMSLDDFLSQELVLIRRRPSRKSKAGVGARRRDISHLEPKIAALLDAGDDRALPAVKALARDLGVNQNMLAARGPRMREYIARRRAARTERRREREAQELDIVLEAARRCYAETGRINSHQLTKFLPKRLVVSQAQPAVRRALDLLRRELSQTKEKTE